MNYRVLASDYDGTIADEGVVSPATLAALQAFRTAGHTLVLVTGRQLADLMRVFPAYRLCARIVAENGALLYDPATQREQLLAPASAGDLSERLAKRGVPLHRGRVIQATDTVYLEEVRAAISETRSELEIILNKDALMLLPPGIDKGTGLLAALESLSLSCAETIGVGDAENDIPLLKTAGAGVALFNALPILKQQATWVTQRSAGAGVVELIEAWLASDLGSLRKGG